MATIERPPLFTRVHTRDSSAALQTSLLRGSSLVLLSAVVTLPGFNASHFPNPVPRQFPPELRTFLGSGVPELISVMPSVGIGWNETPGPRKVQQPEITPNISLLAQPIITPFDQSDWPNPTLPDRWAAYRAFAFRNAQTSVAVAGPPLTGSNLVSWSNPIQPSKAVSMMPWVQGLNALPITPPPVGGPGQLLKGLYIGIRIGF